jgi:hypothetical protein
LKYLFFQKNYLQKLIGIWDEGRLLMQGKKEKMLLEKYNVVFGQL